MARKPITNEDVNPSYEEIINELVSVNSKLLMENTMMRLTIKKLESLVMELNQDDYQEPDEAKKEF
jgi:hypothetical protein